MFISLMLCFLGHVGARVLMETDASSGIRGLPHGWTAGSRSPASQGLQLMFAVKQTNLAELESAVLRVSYPDSAQYGQHLSNEEVHALVAPEQRHIDAVMNFLNEHGIEAVALTSNSDLIEASVTVEQAEMLLDAEYYQLTHKDSGLTVHRAMKYTLPASVADAIDFVSPTVHIPAPKKVKKVAAGTEFANNSPKVLRELYSVGDALGKAPKNKMAVTAFLDQKYKKSDLEKFWQEFCDGLTCGKGDPTLVGDETTGARSGIESMLDIETITGVAGNVTAEFWGFAGRSPDNKENEPFMKWLAQVSTTSDDAVPKIFSTSYGEDEKSWSRPAAERLNAEFQKAGARGISLLYASGDEGANCKNKKFVPETPGSSPWVTAVGGTYQGGEAGIGLSSGGFSDYWAMPEWQTAAVKNYLTTAKNLPPASDGYNISGRAYPDIAAQASDFTVVANGLNMRGVAGTSCASPSAAGIIALLNDARLQAGKPVLGFLNPWIYQNQGKWNDITKGSNEGGGCGAGWPATVGWDAVTGVGSPNYKQLVASL